jgi:hypothetical protein
LWYHTCCENFNDCPSVQNHLIKSYCFHLSVPLYLILEAAFLAYYAKNLFSVHKVMKLHLWSVLLRKTHSILNHIAALAHMLFSASITGTNFCNGNDWLLCFCEGPSYIELDLLYFPAHKTQFFPRKMWPKFDPHLIHRG